MKLLLRVTFLLWVAGAGCRQHSEVPDYIQALTTDTTLFTAPQRQGVIHDPGLAEVSGIAPSVRNPGYLWTEEDSGSPSQLQLISPDGTVAGRFSLPTLTNQDWEDIATATNPKTGQSYVYVAEIGDNAARPVNRLFHRLMHWTASKRMYRFAEPALTTHPPLTTAITAVDTITMILPYGPRDAEAVLVDPLTTDIWLLTKGPDCELYRARSPGPGTTIVRMDYHLTLPFSKVTSAAISPNGREILIRTYSELFYYQRRVGESIPEALRQMPRLLPLAFEPQGEAVGWRLDGSGYYTTSEFQSDTEPVLSLYRRKPGVDTVPARH